MNKAALMASSGLAFLASNGLFPAGVMMAPRSIEELQEERDGLFAECETLVGSADEAGEDLSAEQLAEVEEKQKRMQALDKQIGIRQQLEASRPPPPQGQGRRSSAEQQNRGEGEGGRRTVPPQARDSRGGFRSFGEFAMAVRGASQQGVQPDARLMNAATTYGNEGTGADGGFAVPPEYARTIMMKVDAEDSLFNRATPLTPGGNSMVIPKDETTPWQTSGGIQVYWENEGGQITASKPSLEMSTVRLVKLTALVPISEELLEDAPGLESWLMAKAPSKMVSKLNTAVVRGTGVGQPLGILASPSLISVAKETSQPAGSIWKANIDKMWSRLYAPWRRNAIWIVNQDIEPALENMAFAPLATVPTAASVPVYMPPGGVADTPYARLKGRPVIPLEATSTLGHQGDIILADMAQYWALRKAGGIQSATSMHLYFDQAIMAFRFIFRVNGMPAWSSTIARQNGTNTLSWAVTLDAR